VARRSKDTEPEQVVLTDPAAVRALAHPARLTVIDALYDGAVLTATECAERAGVTPSAMSYHLRALEKAGLVVRAEARGDGRERPWKRAGATLVIDVARKGEESTPAGLAAAELLVANSLDLDRQRLLDSIRADSRRPKAEGRGSHYARDTVVLTTDELKELAASVDALLEPYRRANRGELPPGATSYAASFLVAQEQRPG
jgi:DNA-binding transcriptional ArsR family regulator